MERKDFLKGIGILGMSNLVLGNKVIAGTYDDRKRGTCVLIPSETEGPYPLMNYYNSGDLRSDIRESQEGVVLNLKLKIMGLDNCLPIKNALVYIWHCNNHGYYSGYANQPGYLGTKDYTGATWLRGVQMTDANGEVNFKTNFPGWYTSRVTHIHFRVYLNSVLQATSQLSFPVEARDTIQATSLYSAHGKDPLTPATDSVLKDGYDDQMATLTANTATGGYDSYLEVAINGSGTVGLQQLEPETGAQFKLGQNHPNPYDGYTNIPLTLYSTSDVKIELIDPNGKQVKVINYPQLLAGNHELNMDFNSLGLSISNYIYLITVTNTNGTFSQGKMMSAQIK